MNQAIPNGDTSLFAAARQSQLPVAKLLLDRGENENQARTDGFTSLFIAAGRGLLAVVELLVDRGASVNHSNADGTTATSGFDASDLDSYFLSRFWLHGPHP